MDTETMIDDTETKSAKPPRRPRGLVNALWVKGLDQAEQLTQVAQRESITPVLLAEELPVGFAAALLAKVGACRAQLALYLSATGDKQSATAREKELRLVLIGLLQGVQTAAKRKWARSATEHSQLKAYYVGITLKNLGFAGLAEAADAILRQARLDTLPGVSTEKLTALEVAMGAWKAKNAAQSEEQNAATRAHAETERLFKEITDERIQLQLTADAAFPYTDKANGAIRTEFDLPKNGPYKTA
ncbi:hypothetical protein [Armatimonas sp.]|uniref:hypothetical protein n=1 Tax=Armatimonas sp. TaxID=1872638 RepID=UPI00286AB0BA|nr:hypothetical protein [Armatimonas sp.]